MSRIRSIKPEYWASSQVVACCRDARLLFAGLWNFCDDCGRHPADLGSLKREVLPGDRVSLKTVGKWVQQLLDSKDQDGVPLLLAYTIKGKSYWQVTGWNHQYIQKPQPARYPGPDYDNGTVALPEGYRPETIRSDPKGSEGICRSFDRSIDRQFLQSVDWEKVRQRCKDVAAPIFRAWAMNNYKGSEVVGTTPWRMPAEFRDKLLIAAATVEAGILPAHWLENAIAMMLEGPRKKSPTGWLGKVLASTAREDHAVDWDSFRRAIEIPKDFFEEPSDA